MRTAMDVLLGGRFISIPRAAFGNSRGQACRRADPLPGLSITEIPRPVNGGAGFTMTRFGAIDDELTAAGHDRKFPPPDKLLLSRMSGLSLAGSTVPSRGKGHAEGSGAGPGHSSWGC